MVNVPPTKSITEILLHNNANPVNTANHFNKHYKSKAVILTETQTPAL